MSREEDELLREVADDVIKGNVALWIAENATYEQLDAEALSVSWMAVWTEQTTSQFADSLNSMWISGQLHDLPPRLVRQVPDRIATTLGAYFSFVDICPVFYMNGLGDSWSNRPAREVRRDRDEKTDILETLGSATLLVVGLSSAEQITTFIHELATDIPLKIVILDARSEDIKAVVTEISPQDSHIRLRFISKSLIEVIRISDGMRQDRGVDASKRIRVGNQQISIASQLHRESPIDQDFEIVTLDLVQPLPDQLSNEEKITSLVRGEGAPWRALRDRLHWRRYDKLVSQLVTSVQNESKNSRTVSILNIPIEPGSGATTFLREVSLLLATDGYPTLLHRDTVNEIDYDTLRVFLESLPDEKKSFRPVLVFDSTDLTLTSEGRLGHLPSKLARDGQWCVIIRGVQISENQRLDSDFKDTHSLSHRLAKFSEQWLSTRLKSRLANDEQTSLCKWVEQHWPQPVNNLMSVISDWETTNASNPPLLIYLYFILQKEIRVASEIGRHLFSRIVPLLQPARRDEDAKPLSANDLETAIQKLQQRFNRSVSQSSPDTTPVRSLISPRIVLETFIVLVVLAKLRIPVPRGTLQRIVSATSAELQEVLFQLEKVDLSSVMETSERSPSAYYRKRETVGLRHPGYGDVVVEWFQEGCSGYDSSVQSELFSSLQSIIGPELETFPIGLLGPILRRLSPITDDIAFAEDIATRYLRLQRLNGSEYHSWLWRGSHSDQLLGLFDCIDEQLVRQSPSLLHSRGITRYKSCMPSLDLATCRTRYEQAVQDFELARQRAEEISSGEPPANILSSHGMLHLGWARKERDDPSGSNSRANDCEDRANSLFNESLGLRPGNPYAAFGLINIALDRSERAIRDRRSTHDSESDEIVAKDIGEACRLLQSEPTDSLRVDWEKLWLRLVSLLSDTRVKQITKHLRSEGNDMGYAIDALAELNGRIPQEPTTDPGEVDEINKAIAVLNEASNLAHQSAFGGFLRYVLFSAHPDRISQPDFQRRFELIEPLLNTAYLKEPIWLFDYGMLALQLRKFTEGQEAFKKLRSGRRFLDVPMGRSEMYVDLASFAPKVEFMRVVQVDPTNGRGWARLDTIPAYRDPIPFHTSEFSSAGRDVRVGSTTSCLLRIRPSGFVATPNLKSGKHE